MMKRHVSSAVHAALTIALCAACASQGANSPPAEPTSPPSENAGETSRQPAPAASVTDGVFRSVVPNGFSRRDLPNVISLVRTERSPTPDSFLSSIVVMPVRYASPAQRTDVANPKKCRAAAEVSAQALRNDHGVDPKHVRQEVVRLPSGAACQYEMRVSSVPRPHAVIGTLLQSQGGDRMVVCNVAVGDDVGKAGCQSFLQLWAWNKAAPE